MTTVPTAFDLLKNEIKQKCDKASVVLDVYDPDFILGVIIGWLDDNDAVLTARGIEKED